MLEADLAAKSDSENRKTADFVKPPVAYSGLGVSDQASRVQKQSLPVSFPDIREFMGMSEDDYISIPHVSTMREEVCIGDVIFFSVGHQDPMRNVGISFITCQFSEQ